ncbi:Phosphoenolpyruvate carboxylase 4 [Glycine soja]
MTDITDDIAEEISFQGFEDDCKLLGNLLNDILQREAGSTFVDKLEKIRVLSQSACNMRQAGMEDLAEMLEKQLASELSKMTLEEALPLARAFSHHLTLMGFVKEEIWFLLQNLVMISLTTCFYKTVFKQNLVPIAIVIQNLISFMLPQEVEIVLTAHPTQINHRTLQYKHLKIAVGEKTSIWQTDELRRSKPTPVDEARAGKPLPLTCTPIKFGSWMGGDRDGNPNVTAKVTKDVSLLSRWMAIDLYIREVDGLRFELSMNQCSDKLSELAHEILKEGNDEEDHHEHWNGSMSRSQSKHPNQQASPLPTKLPAGAHIPSCAWPEEGGSEYPRHMPGADHKQPNHKGGETSSSTESNGGSQNVRSSIPILPNSSSSLVSMTYSPSFNSSQLVAQRKLFAESQIGRTSFQRLLEPNSELSFSSTFLQQLCGSGVLADGRLADLIRRVATFGMVLMKLDLRQESSRHAETIDVITRYLDMGTYSEWDEEKKLDFLTRELKGKRPLVPPSIEAILKSFEMVSGLRINFANSQFGAIGQTEDWCRFAADYLNCGPLQFPFSYLGMPIGVNPRRKVVWEPIIRKFEAKLNKWNQRNVSMAGRITLISSVLTALPLFYMSFFRAPSVIDPPRSLPLRCRQRHLHLSRRPPRIRRVLRNALQEK